MTSVFEMLFEVVHVVAVPRDHYHTYSHSDPIGYDLQIANRHLAEMLTVFVVRPRDSKQLQLHEALERSALTLMRAAQDLEKGGDGSIPFEKPTKHTVRELAQDYVARTSWVGDDVDDRKVIAFEAGYAAAVNRRAE